MISENMETKIKLQQALNSTGYHGEIIKVFSSHFDMQYEVGIAELKDGQTIVVKIKEKYRGQQQATHSRETEYKNLQMLHELNEMLIPEPLYYEDGILLMSFIDGTALGKSNKDKIEPTEFEKLGRIVRKINDISMNKTSHLPVIKNLTEFLEERKQHLYENRLVLEYFSQEFYDQIIDEMRRRIQATDGDMGVIWKDGNADNILFKDNKLVGLLDFEDMAIAPRIIQFYSLKSIGDENMDAFAEGYGKELFEKNYDETNLKILKVFSVLNAIGLAHNENAQDWLNASIEKLGTLVSELRLKVNLPSK